LALLLPDVLLNNLDFFLISERNKIASASFEICDGLPGKVPSAN
jgi:hypothetical protein